MGYGERLRWARKQADLTQQELANISGVKQGSISKIERGEQSESSYDPILAFHLRVSAYWLTTGEGDPLDGVLTEEEKELLEAYRASEGDQKNVFDFLKAQALKKGKT